MVTHAKCWIGIKIVLTLGLTVMHSYSGCNSPNGPYTITIDGGKTAAQDGETVSYMCVETPNVDGIPSPTWILTPTGGGGNGLTAPSITTVGNVAQIEWFWHAGGGEVPSCTYVLKCKTTEDCVATKTITVTVPSPGGYTGVYIDVTIKKNRVGWSNYFEIQGTEAVASVVELSRYASGSRQSIHLG